ncbi:MAG: class I SAM-dependent methyltransferase [Chitinispirillaceae bacterium]|nr:class I SAM-dependent methyltransferase [Chitinispirillaceae bacterium]
MPHNHHVCPWWIGYLLISPLRRLMQDPWKILSPYVRPDMTVLEIGPGMGYFTIPLARMTGPRGRVVSVDIQEKMLATLRKRADRAGLSDRIETRLIQADSLGVADLECRFDFALAFAVVHEVPDQAVLFRELHAALKPGGALLIADPRSHFSEKEYKHALDLSADAGFEKTGEPDIWRSRAGELRKLR